MLQTIAERIKKLKQSIDNKEELPDDLGTAALVTCLTCGTGKQREVSPPRPFTSPAKGLQQASLDSASFDKLSYTLGEDVMSREDYDTIVQMMKGEAKLKPIGRQYIPMKPKPNPFLRRTKDKEIGDKKK